MAEQFQKILVAIDRSTASEQVFTQALTLAQSLHAHLIILSAIDLDYSTSYINPPIYPGGEGIALSDAALGVYLENQERERLQGLALLQNFANRAQAVGIQAEINQQLGDPGRSICTVAQNHSVDLIIVGRRGHRGLNELFMGSVSNYVLHHAPCSVLIIQG